MPSRYDRLCSQRLLRKAWRALNKSNRFSHGFDNETIQAFTDRLDSNIENISEKLKKREYSFVPLRAKPIPKEGGGTRILRIPAVKDRLVLTALKIIIAPRFKKLDRPCSHGYVKNRSRFTAISAIRNLSRNGNEWVLEADIKKFFDNVPRDILRSKFVKEIRMRSIIPIIEQAITTEVGNLEDFDPEEKAFLMADSGIPQGGVLSPMLSNFYLSEFDIAMENAFFNLVRYADDFVVMCRSKEEAQRAYALCLDVLEKKLALQIHHLGDPGNKTRIFRFLEGFTFLGLEFGGDKIRPSKKAVERFKSRIQEILDPASQVTMLRTLSSLRNTITGWGEAFKQYHSTAVFQELDEYTRESLTQYFRGRGFLPSRNALSTKEVRSVGIPSLQRIRQQSDAASSNTAGT
jgi:RNA-directed DNA polymerase